MISHLLTKCFLQLLFKKFAFYHLCSRCRQTYCGHVHLCQNLLFTAFKMFVNRFGIIDLDYVGVYYLLLSTP